MTELEKLMNSLNPSLLSKIKDFAASKDGEKLIKSFPDDKKDELLGRLNSMSEAEKAALIQKAIKNPGLLSKIKEML